MTVCLKSNTKRKEVKIKDMKLNISQIARDQGVSWPTAKKIVLGNTSRKKREFKGTSKLESYKDVIDYKLEMYQCSAVSIYDLISAKGYLGSKSLVTKYVKQKKENLLNKVVELNEESLRFFNSLCNNDSFSKEKVASVILDRIVSEANKAYYNTNDISYLYELVNCFYELWIYNDNKKTLNYNHLRKLGLFIKEKNEEYELERSEEHNV